MGRFYQTSSPEFVEDIMYQPPWQLMNQVLATKQQGYDNALQSTELFKNMLDIKHLGFDDERAKEIKEYWNSKIDTITEQLKKNPGDFSKVMPKVRDLARELDTDRKEGTISKLEGRYNSWNQWQKDNEDIQKADPDLFNKLASHWYNDVQSRSSKDIKAAFNGTKGINKPDFNSKDMREALKEFKANATETSNGMYKINNKWLSESEVQQAVYDMYMSNPNSQAYAKQMMMLKDPGYYDDNTGTAKDLFQLVDTQGNIISREKAIELQEQYSKLNKEEKEKTPFPFSRQLNSEHGFAGGIKGWGNILGFKESKIEEDKYGLAAKEHQYKISEINTGKAWDSKIQGQRDAAAMSRLKVGKQLDVNKMILEFDLKDKEKQKDFENKLKLTIAENGEDSPEGQGAIKMLNGLYAKESIGIIGNPDVSYNKDYDSVMSNREKSNSPNDGKNYFTAKPGTAAYQENLRLKQATEYAKNKLGNNKEAKEYLNWLGDRRPSEELAKQFLESKGVYQKPSYSQSIAGNWWDSQRQISLGQSEQAKKWTQIYDIGKNYEKYVGEWYDTKHNNQSMQVSVNPVSLEGKSMLMKELNSNSGNYFTTDDKGNPYNMKKGIKDIIGVTGGNNQSNIGFQIIDEEGKKGWIFPSANNDNVKQLSRNLGLLSVQDKNSAFAVEAKSAEYNRIQTELQKGFKSSDGRLSNVINLPLGGRVVMHQNSDGTVEVRDEDDSQKIGTFKNLDQVVNKMLGN